MSVPDEDNRSRRRQFLKRAGGAAMGATALLALPERRVRAAVTAAACAPLCVKDYGATGDGKTDDTAAIQKAVDAAHAVNGSEIFLPSGNYVVSALTLPNNITLYGAGRDVTVITAMHPDGDVVTMTNFFSHIRNLAMNSLGGKPRTSGAYIRILHPAVECTVQMITMHHAYIGLHISAAETSDVSYATIKEMSSAPGSAAILYDDGDDHSIHRVTAKGNEDGRRTPDSMPSYGVWSKGLVGCIQMSDSDFIRMGACLYVQGGDSIYAMNTFFDDSTYGILIEPETESVRGHFIGCWASENTQDGVRIRSPKHPSPSVGVGDQDFIGHHGFLNKGDAFHIEEGYNIQIANSDIAQNDGSGIVLGPKAVGCRITNNMIGNTGRLSGNANGIVLDPACRDNLILGNRIVGNTKTQVTGTGVGNAIHMNMGVDI